MIPATEHTAPRSHPRLKRSATIVFVREPDAWVILNYLSRACVECSELSMALLTAADHWVSLHELTGAVAASTAETLAAIEELLAGKFLLEEHSDDALREARYEELWDWDVRAGLYHFSIKDADWLSDDERVAELECRVTTRPDPGKFKTNVEFSHVVGLERPTPAGELSDTFLRRRTHRLFAQESISLDALNHCLYYGLGITGWIEDPVEGMGRQPLKCTPSGGARNPFEAYVYAARVDGLPPGLYHYSAVEHSLGLVHDEVDPGLGQRLLGGQSWTNTAAAAIWLVANFRRTMWKYPHPNVYRALYLEAGHIGQNIMLAATAHGMSVAPTAAICDSMTEDFLRIDSITEGALYALVMGIPRPDTRPTDYR